MVKKKVDSKPLCKECGSGETVSTIFDTLSVDARPIKEKEVKCLACGIRRCYPVDG